jgi:hypothetical protein
MSSLSGMVLILPMWWRMAELVYVASRINREDFDFGGSMPSH